MSLPPLPDSPRVAVVVPARDAADTLTDAVRSALAQAPVDDVVIAVPPADEATLVAVADLRAADRRVRSVPNPAGSTPTALNAAIESTNADVVVRLDAHAVLPPGYVATAVDTLRKTGAANVGGKQVPVGTAGFRAAVAAAMRSPLGAGGAAYRTGRRPGPADTVYLGVFRRDVLLAVGGFDARLLRNQDAELNERLRRAGHVVWFEPALEVRYAPRATLRALASQYLQYGRYRRFTARLHPGSLRWRQLAPVLLLTGLVATVVLGIATRSPLLPAAAVAGYGALLAVAGLRAADVRRAPAVALALGTMHLAWAVGFVLGPPRTSGPDAGSTD